MSRTEFYQRRIFELKMLTGEIFQCTWCCWSRMCDRVVSVPSKYVHYPGSTVIFINTTSSSQQR